MRALDADPTGALTVLGTGTCEVVVTYPDEVLHDASAKMLRNNIGRLPVVERDDPRRVVGYLGSQKKILTTVVTEDHDELNRPRHRNALLPCLARLDSPGGCPQVNSLPTLMTRHLRADSTVNATGVAVIIEL
jgi:predicted transcriptional regulator